MAYRSRKTEFNPCVFSVLALQFYSDFSKSCQHKERCTIQRDYFHIVGIQKPKKLYHKLDIKIWRVSIRRDGLFVFPAKTHSPSFAICCLFRGLKNCQQIVRCNISNDDLHISRNSEVEKVSKHRTLSTNRLSTYRTIECIFELKSV